MTTEERFWSKVDRGTRRQCWNWKAALCGPYGFFWLNGKNQYAHRVSWEFENGLIPDALVIDHKCMNKKCVNPNHLQVVTKLENCYVSTTKHQAVQKRCKYGHSLKRAPLRISFAGFAYRHCILCDKQRVKSNRKIIDRRFKIENSVAIQIRKRRALSGLSIRKIAKEFKLGKESIRLVLLAKRKYPAVIK